MWQTADRRCQGPCKHRTYKKRCTQYVCTFDTSYGSSWCCCQRRCYPRHTRTHAQTHTHTHTHRVSKEECARLRESVPYVKVYRYDPKHLYPKLNGYGDNGQRKVRSSCGSTYCTCLADALRVHQNAQSANLNQYFNTAGYSCAM